LTTHEHSIRTGVTDMPEKHQIDTRVVHAGELDPTVHGAVVLPIFQTAMFETGGGEDYHDIRYIRLNNCPNHQVLHDKLASLESAEAGLVTASGMAAISTALLTVLGAGDHLIAQDVLYGGTHSMIVHDFPKLGIEVDFVDGADPDSWEAKRKPNTKAIYVETISNPLITVPALAQVPAFAKANGLVSMIDNTFASPVNFRPAEHGYDLSLHSATKYLNGHNDIVAGAVVGDGDLVEQVRHKLNHLGGSLDPHACFLLNRGIMTLALRIARQNESALAIARFLDEHPAISNVNYAGLVSSPHHERAKAWLDGYGGMMSFELAGGADAAQKLLDLATIPMIAPSLGGVESLLTRPATTSHQSLSPEARAAIGISDGLVRMSVGVESVDDLIDDLGRALDA